MASRDARRPIVMFTNDEDTRHVKDAVAAGVSAYVVAGLAPERIRPILEVAMARFQYEQALRRELADVRSELHDRKLIDRAKGPLMQRQGLSEAEAYARRRKIARDRGTMARPASPTPSTSRWPSRANRASRFRSTPAGCATSGTAWAPPARSDRRLFGRVAEPSVQMNPQEMARRSLVAGDLVHVTSKRGSNRGAGRSQRRDRSQPGFHCNALRRLWLQDHQALLVREELRQKMDQFPFASCVPFSNSVPLAQAAGQSRTGVLLRAAAHEAPADELLARIESLLGLGGADVLRYADPRRGQVVCSCFNVTDVQIGEQLAGVDGDPTDRLANLQAGLKCGTNCGSCLPELKRMVSTAPASLRAASLG